LANWFFFYEIAILDEARVRVSVMCSNSQFPPRRVCGGPAGTVAVQLRAAGQICRFCVCPPPVPPWTWSFFSPRQPQYSHSVFEVRTCTVLLSYARANKRSSAVRRTRGLRSNPTQPNERRSRRARDNEREELTHQAETRGTAPTTTTIREGGAPTQTTRGVPRRED